MPRYSFECPACSVQFERALKMGEHLTHPCPACGGAAPRQWAGQRLGFEFAGAAGTAQGNSGVAMHDYPTADQAVGRSAADRWGEIQSREQLKQEVRRGGKTNGVIRRNSPDGRYIEYTAYTPEAKQARLRLVEEAAAVKKKVQG